MKAFCYRSGQIGFARRVPFGAICIANFPNKQACFVKSCISANARHAYEGKTLLLPGLPEAANEREAMAALLSFQDRIRPIIEGAREKAR